MLQPDFTPISARYSVEQAIRRMFVHSLDYSPQILNDPSQAVGPKSWRLVFPLPDSRPIAVAQRDALSRMNIQQLRRLYVDEVVRLRDDALPPRPVAYCFTDGGRWVLFSGSPDRTRDDRFDLSPNSWEYENVKQKYWRLSLQELTFTERLGAKQPNIDFLDEEVGLSADRHLHPSFSSKAQPSCAKSANPCSALPALTTWPPLVCCPRQPSPCGAASAQRFHREDIQSSHVYPRLMRVGSLAVRVSKWGNSLAVRLPRTVVDVLGLNEGDSIEIHVLGSRTLEIEKRAAPSELLKRLRKYRGRLPADFKFDRLDANARS